jgi:hypothetical protein
MEHFQKIVKIGLVGPVDLIEMVATVGDVAE